MPVQRVAQRRRWAQCLPVLVALLLAFGTAAVSHDTTQTAGSRQVGTALTGLAASIRPADTGSHPQARPLAQRVEPQAVWLLAAIGHRAYRLAAPSSRWASTAVAATAGASAQGGTHRGRGPPVRV